MFNNLIHSANQTILSMTLETVIFSVFLTLNSAWDTSHLLYRLVLIIITVVKVVFSRCWYYSPCIQKYSKYESSQFSGLHVILPKRDKLRHFQHSHVLCLQFSSATCGVQGALGQYCGGAQWPGASWVHC